MVEAQTREAEPAQMQAAVIVTQEKPPSAKQQAAATEDKRKIREREFLLESQKKKQEVVMKFKRSNDAVLKVYVPDSYNGQGCISCSADHNVRSK